MRRNFGNRMAKTLVLVLLALVGTLAQAQHVRWDNTATTTTGVGQMLPVLALPGASISFYTGCTALPCATPAVTYQSASGASCPSNAQVVWQAPVGTGCHATADSEGNFGGWFAPGDYQYTITINSTTAGPYDFAVAGGGGGVTSAQGTSPIQVNGVSGSPQAGAVKISATGIVIGYPNFDSLVGAFTDSSGNVVEPISIGSGPVTLAVPPGATQLQLGINDDVVSDNTGSWTMSVNGSNYTVLGTSAPWVNSGGINSQYPIGSTGATAPVVVTMGVNTTAVISYVSGTVTDLNGAGFPCGGGGGTFTPDGLANCSVYVDPSTGANMPGKWTLIGNTQGKVNSVSNSDGSLTITPTTGAVVGSINYAHAGTWTALETFNAGVSIPSGQGVTQTTDGSTANCWNTAGTTSACSGGAGGLPSATGAGQPIASTGAGTTYQALTNMTMDGTNIKSAGAGACPVVGTGTVICLTAAPYYASPYGATTTTGTFAAAATSGTVGSCSTFSANEGVLIAGGATGGWNGTSYIGTVVSCSGTTLTITPAITNAVSGATVQHDETAAFTSAITALGSLGGTIFLPNAANNVQGVYLVNGALQDSSGANAIIKMPVVANQAAVLNIKFQGATKWLSTPVIQTSLSTSGASLFGAYGSTDPHFTGVGLWFQDVSIYGPTSGSETMINGTWDEVLGFEGSVRVQGATSGIATTGNGVLFPTIANNVAINASGILAVQGFGTAVRLGEHVTSLQIAVANSTNGVVFDVAPTGLFGDNTQLSVSVDHIWCGPPSTPNGPTTVTNCLVGGTSSTTIVVNDVDYEGTGGNLVSDPSNFLHGTVKYVLANAAACPTTPTLSGAANLVLTNLNCTTGGISTATQGATTAAHMAVFGSDGHDIVDGGAVPSGGSGAWTNITGAVTWTGCTAGTNSCSVVTPGNSITISAIPSTYTTLIIYMVGRVTDGANTEPINMRLNGDTGSNYDAENVIGTGSTASATETNTANVAVPISLPGASTAAAFAGVGTIAFPFYANTSFYKNGIANSSAEMAVANFYDNRQTTFQWRSTAAINSITLADAAAGNLAAGTQIAIYGVR